MITKRNILVVANDEENKAIIRIMVANPQCWLDSHLIAVAAYNDPAAEAAAVVQPFTLAITGSQYINPRLLRYTYPPGTGRSLSVIRVISFDRCGRLGIMVIPAEYTKCSIDRLPEAVQKALEQPKPVAAAAAA